MEWQPMVFSAVAALAVINMIVWMYERHSVSAFLSGFFLAASIVEIAPIIRWVTP